MDSQDSNVKWCMLCSEEAKRRSVLSEEFHGEEALGVFSQSALDPNPLCEALALASSDLNTSHCCPL